MEYQNNNNTMTIEDVIWHEVGHVSKFSDDAGRCAKINNIQIAIFYYRSKNKWYACQNLCPHKQEMVLARGLIGDCEGMPKVACPLHKNTFSLVDGTNMNGDLTPISTYPVKVKDEIVYVGLLR